MAANRLDALLDGFLQEGVPGCALSVTLHGKKVYESFRGFARPEEEKPVTKDTIFQLFSNTKNLTTTAIMILYEQGRILLNDPICRYLPFFENMKYQFYDGTGEITLKPVSHPITIRELLTMTSGIPSPGRGSITQFDYMEKIPNPYSRTTMELAEEISKQPLEFDPGSHWHYGWGFEVLGALIEAVSGKSFGDFLTENIFKPLGMKQTSFLYKNDMAERMAGTYLVKDGKAVKLDIMPRMTEDNKNRCESGGGGLISTMEDMTRFAEMWAMGGVFRNVRILSRNTINLIRENHLSGSALSDFRELSCKTWPWYRGYGWGLGVRTLMNRAESGSNGSVGEFGWCGAGGTYLLADPERELSVMYMHQIFPVSSQGYFHPRIRNTVYSMLDEWE